MEIKLLCRNVNLFLIVKKAWLKYRKVIGLMNHPSLGKVYFWFFYNCLCDLGPLSFSEPYFCDCYVSELHPASEMQT